VTVRRPNVIGSIPFPCSGVGHTDVIGDMEVPPARLFGISHMDIARPGYGFSHTD
jgi:hypothetical protein